MRTQHGGLRIAVAVFLVWLPVARAVVTVSSPHFVFIDNWPANQPVATGSYVPAVPMNLAASTAGAVPFANGVYNHPAHTIAHLNDSRYGNDYSWLTTGGTLSRAIALGGSYGTVNMAFAGVAFSNAEPRTVSAIIFGRDASNTFKDRYFGSIYIQVATTNSLAALTNLTAEADAVWTTLGSFTTTDPFEHRFALIPSLQITGVRMVCDPRNCIDEIVAHGTGDGFQTWGTGSTVSTNFSYSGDWPMQPVATGSAVPATPPNLAYATNGAIPFAISEYDGSHNAGYHKISYLNDGKYGNPSSWIAATNTATLRDVALGGEYGSINLSFAGVAFSNATPFLLSDIAFGQNADGQYSDRVRGNIYIQVTTAGSVAEITNTAAVADALWTTLGYVTTTNGYQHQFVFNRPVQATGVRIVTANGNCIDEIVVHGVPATASIWDAVAEDGAATDGAGLWDTVSSNWWDGTANTSWPNGGVAVIGVANGAAGAIAVGDGVSVSGIQFHTAGSGSYQITGNPLSLVGTAVIHCAADLTISAALAGNGFEKFGAGALTVSAANSYTGATVLSQGAVNVAAVADGGTASSLGASSADAANLVFAEGTLRYTGPTAGTDRRFTIRPYQSAVVDVAEAGTTLTFTKLGGSALNATVGIIKNGPGTLVLGNEGGVPFLGDIGGYTVNQGRLLAHATSPAQLNLRWTAGRAALTLGDGALFDNGYTALRTEANLDEQVVRYTGTNQTAELTGLCFCGPTSNYNTKTFDVNDGTAGVDLLMSSNIVIYPLGTGISRLRKSGSGTLQLTGPSLYRGMTLIRDGRILVTNDVLSGVAGPLGQSAEGLLMGEAGTPKTAVMTFAFEGTGPFTFDRDITVATNGSAAVLGCLSDADATFSGAILISNAVHLLSVATDSRALTVAGTIGGIGSVTKTGTGTVVLAAANTYTGVTTVAEGTLRLGASDRIADTGALRLTGGTFDSAGHSDTLGTLDVDGTAVIDLGSGSSTLRFADSAVQTWSGTLTLRNGSGGGTGRLFIGTTSGGASAQQLDRIMFPNGRKAIQLATGEVVPVPQGTLIRFN